MATDVPAPTPEPTYHVQADCTGTLGGSIGLRHCGGGGIAFGCAHVNTGAVDVGGCGLHDEFCSPHDTAGPGRYPCQSHNSPLVEFSPTDRLLGPVAHTPHVDPARSGVGVVPDTSDLSPSGSHEGLVFVGVRPERSGVGPGFFYGTYNDPHQGPLVSVGVYMEASTHLHIGPGEVEVGGGVGGYLTFRDPFAGGTGHATTTTTPPSPAPTPGPTATSTATPTATPGSAHATSGSTPVTTRPPTPRPQTGTGPVAPTSSAPTATPTPTPAATPGRAPLDLHERHPSPPTSTTTPTAIQTATPTPTSTQPTAPVRITPVGEPVGDPAPRPTQPTAAAAPTTTTGVRQPATGTPQTTNQSSVTHQVVGTCRDGNCGLNRRTAPSLDSSVVGAALEGSTLQVVCQARGDTVSNGRARTNVWNRLSDGTWVSDFYVNTQRVGEFSDHIPRC